MSTPLISYFNMINNAWKNKAGEALADCLSCRHNHVENINLHINNPEIECREYFDSPLEEVVAIHLRCIRELNDKDFSAAYDAQMLVVQSVTKMFQSLTDENWLLPVINTVCVDLRLVGTRLMTQSGKGIEPLEKVAECLIACFKICAADKETSELDTKRWGMMSLVNQLFKLYYRINQFYLMKPLIQAIDSSQLKDRFTIGQQVTYKYFVGRLAMFYGDYYTANNYLLFAFIHCHKMSKKNKRLILMNLIPIRILLGYMPTKEILEKYDLMQLWEVVLAVKRGCNSELSNVVHKNLPYSIKFGIFDTIEELRIITYRNFFKKVYLCLKTCHISMYDLVTALQCMEDENIELEDAHCILSTLIYKGMVKGSICVQHQKLVLSRVDPFPKLGNLN